MNFLLMHGFLENMIFLHYFEKLIHLRVFYEFNFYLSIVFDRFLDSCFLEDKLEEGLLRVNNENEIETKRHFSCFGCSFRAARLSQISQHLDLQVLSRARRGHFFLHFSGVYSMN